MKYEIVTLEEKIAVGISARTNNLSPDMGAVIGGLWNRFYNEKADYTTVVACETSEEPPQEMRGQYTVCRIPAGRYARFIVHGDMVQAVAAAWQEIWQMDLPRTFRCDFEEYQNDCMDQAEIHIYVGLK